MCTNRVSVKIQGISSNLTFPNVYGIAVLLQSSENMVEILKMRLSVRTWDLSVIYICVYGVETSKDIDESLKSLCAIFKVKGTHRKP